MEENQMKKLILIAFMSAMSTAPSFANDSNPWSNEVELGFLLNRGNTHNTHFDSRFTNQFENQAWHNTASVASLVDVNRDTTTRDRIKSAEKYAFLDNLKFNLTNRDYIFTEFDAVKDKFSAFDYEFSESIGYGRKLIDTNQITWNLEGGPGARHSRTTSLDQSKLHQDSFVAHVGTNFQFALTESAAFTQQISHDYGDNVQKTKATSAIKAKVWDKVSMKLSYLIEYNAKLPATGINQNHTDTTTTLTATYVF